VLALVRPAASARGYLLRPVPATAPYAANLQAEPGPLLEISFDPSQGTMRQVQAESVAMFRTIGYWRPILNGYGSYWPREYQETVRLMSRLPEDAGALEILRKQTGVEWIVVWPGRLPPEKRAAWDAVKAGHDHPSLSLVASGEQGALLFRVAELHAGL